MFDPFLFANTNKKVRENSSCAVMWCNIRQTEGQVVPWGGNCALTTPEKMVDATLWTCVASTLCTDMHSLLSPADQLLEIRENATWWTVNTVCSLYSVGPVFCHMTHYITVWVATTVWNLKQQQKSKTFIPLYCRSSVTACRDWCNEEIVTYSSRYG